MSYCLITLKQDQNPIKPEVKTEEDDAYRGPMKNFEKPKMEVQTSPEQPPSKKRRIDTESDDPISAKLNQIRNNMDSNDQTQDHKPLTSKERKKQKKKNKSVEQSEEQSKQPDFDYSSVDFKKFGGGSISEKKNEIKMKFHGKVS